MTKCFFVSWRDKVNLQKQDLEKRSCKTPHTEKNISKTVQLDIIANSEISMLLKENNTWLNPNDIDFNSSITEHNQSTSNEIRAVYSLTINGKKYLKTGTQLQIERHRNYLHEKIFKIIHFTKLLFWKLVFLRM